MYSNEELKCFNWLIYISNILLALETDCFVLYNYCFKISVKFEKYV